MKALPAIWKYFLHVLLPKTCLHCLKDLPWESNKSLCSVCEGALEPLPELHCARCGLPLKSGGQTCYDCRGQKSAAAALELARSAFVFNAELRSLIHAFKYSRMESLCGPLSEAMAGAWDRFPELKDYNFVLAVPLHPAKKKERGFNQSELLAEKLAAAKHLFLLKNSAARALNTKPQVSLSKEERASNMKSAFKITRPELVKGRKILLIDDVATTLSTLEELARELKKNGAKGVAALTLAREP
ncbi:MAG: ComF family protein [Elusimicrobia bacterium]|nr:ComF family protein [Elusimicrobiota bacterium]